MTIEDAIACVRRYSGCGHPAIHAALVLAVEVERLQRSEPVKENPENSGRKTSGIQD